MKLRKCNKCTKLKNLDQFLLMKNGYYHSYCKLCRNKITDIWRKNNPDKVKQSMRKFRFKSRYGLSLDEVENKKFLQNNMCAICNRETNKLEIDHSHSTKEIRKLLCHNCNMLLGYAKENIVILNAAIDYLLEYAMEVVK